MKLLHFFPLPIISNYGANDLWHYRQIAPLLLDIKDDFWIMQEEFFGPLLPIIIVNNVEECFDVINSMPKPLAAYLLFRNKAFEERFVKTVFAGGILINDTTMYVSILFSSCQCFVCKRIQTKMPIVMLRLLLNVIIFT